MRRALLVLAACALSCAPRTRSGVDAPPPPSPSAPARPDAGVTTPPPAAYAPSFDHEMQCRRRHCYAHGAGRCLDTCYKYNHPRDPQAHEACNATCRRNYDVEACEQACARDRRAYAPIPASVPARCRAALRACRASCDATAPNNCELRCLFALEACERGDAG